MRYLLLLFTLFSTAAFATVEDVFTENSFWFGQHQSIIETFYYGDPFPVKMLGDVNGDGYPFETNRRPASSEESDSYARCEYVVRSVYDHEFVFPDGDDETGVVPGEYEPYAFKPAIWINVSGYATRGASWDRPIRAVQPSSEYYDLTQAGTTASPYKTRWTTDPVTGEFDQKYQNSSRITDDNGPLFVEDGCYDPVSGYTQRGANPADPCPGTDNKPMFTLPIALYQSGDAYIRKCEGSDVRCNTIKTTLTSNAYHYKCDNAGSSCDCTFDDVHVVESGVSTCGSGVRPAFKNLHNKTAGNIDKATDQGYVVHNITVPLTGDYSMDRFCALDINVQTSFKGVALGVKTAMEAHRRIFDTASVHANVNVMLSGGSAGGQSSQWLAIDSAIRRNDPIYDYDRTDDNLDGLPDDGNNDGNADPETSVNNIFQDYTFEVYPVAVGGDASMLYDASPIGTDQSTFYSVGYRSGETPGTAPHSRLLDAETFYIDDGNDGVKISLHTNGAENEQDCGRTSGALGGSRQFALKNVLFRDPDNWNTIPSCNSVSGEGCDTVTVSDTTMVYWDTACVAPTKEIWFDDDDNPGTPNISKTYTETVGFGFDNFENNYNTNLGPTYENADPVEDILDVSCEEYFTGSALPTDVIARDYTSNVICGMMFEGSPARAIQAFDDLPSIDFANDLPAIEWITGFRDKYVPPDIILPLCEAIANAHPPGQQIIQAILHEPDPIPNVATAHFFDVLINQDQLPQLNDVFDELILACGTSLKQGDGTDIDDYKFVFRIERCRTHPTSANWYENANHPADDPNHEKYPPANAVDSGGNPDNEFCEVNFTFTREGDGDADQDGLTNTQELVIGTNWHAWDSDGNGVNDAEDDADADGLSNELELLQGTDPLHADTDSDGLSDGWEVAHNQDPLAANYTFALGGRHTCMIDGNEVICWGKNYSGQSSPPSLTDPLQLVAGFEHTCALDQTGSGNTVVCWGDNTHGQLNIPTLTNPVQVVAGWSHNCALDDTGVICWGTNAFGTLTPPALSNPTEIFSGGGWHNCAMDDTGVVCWGRNTDGEVNVPSLTDPLQISLGAIQSCALDNNGNNNTVLCWGNNSHSQLNVPSLSNPTRLWSGYHHICAQDDNGITCWGRNTEGQRNLPTFSGLLQLGLGGFHTCFLDSNGVDCRGAGEAGETLDPNFGQSVPPANLIDPDGDGLGIVEELSAGTDPLNYDTDGDTLSDKWELDNVGFDPMKPRYFMDMGWRTTCAKDDNAMSCWGHLGGSQMPIPALSDPTQIASGLNHVCALDSAGVVCWGNPAFITVPTMTGVTSLKADFRHTCAIHDSGLDCWGKETKNTGKLVPPALTNPTAVALGSEHTCAIDDSGVVCWGAGIEGGTGNPGDDFGQSIAPALAGPSQIAAGSYHSCAIDISGVACWGRNDYGQTDVPTTLVNPVEIDAGYKHTCVIDDTDWDTRGDSIICWGLDLDGESTPPSLINPVTLSLEYRSSCALDDTGIVCWGRNDDFSQAANPSVGQAETAHLWFDTDGDDMTNGWEIANGYDRLLDDGTGDNDDDNDGLSNRDEHNLGTDPAATNTDGDSMDDALEVLLGVNPAYRKYAISSSMYHACAINDDTVTGNLQCWGASANGQLNVPSLTDVAQVGTGKYFTCALDNSGVACWGDNAFGQLNLPLLNSPTHLAVGNFHACVLDGGAVTCWGYNSVVNNIPTLSNPFLVTAGGQAACAADDTGLHCWGADVGSYNIFTVPAAVNNNRILQAGINNYHGCALYVDSADDKNKVACWGRNDSGQSTVPSLDNPTQISVGWTHTCALDSNGLQCWGSNSNGESSGIAGLDTPRQVQAGWTNTCVLDNSGVQCVGHQGIGGNLNAVPATLFFDSDEDTISNTSELTNGTDPFDCTNPNAGGCPP